MPMAQVAVQQPERLTESELAKRWRLNPKTLNRWRCEGKGPRYLKLSGSVRYPLEYVLEFEAGACYAATNQKGAA